MEEKIQTNLEHHIQIKDESVNYDDIILTEEKEYMEKINDTESKEGFSYWKKKNSIQIVTQVNFRPNYNLN